MKEFIVAVDFDGTVVEEAYPQIGNLLPGARQALENFKSLGMTIIIWTCRCDNREQEAIDYLLKHKVPFDYINQNDPRRNEFYNSDSRKISADQYIDDRNPGGFPGWEITEKLVTDLFFEKRN